jgi:hypothetical protein
MELIEIIKSSLSIFSTTALVFTIISFTIYKIKDRSRIKPYLRVNIQKPLGGKLNDKLGIKLNINMDEKSAKENQFNSFVLVKLPIQNKFTIINGNVIVDKLNKLKHKRQIPYID